MVETMTEKINERYRITSWKVGNVRAVHITDDKDANFDFDITVGDTIFGKQIESIPAAKKVAINIIKMVKDNKMTYICTPTFGCRLERKDGKLLSEPL